MEQKTKNYLGIALIIAVMMVAIASWQFVGAYGKSSDPFAPRTLSVSAEGKIVTVPDIAEFTFSVITQGGKNVAVLKDQNTEKVNETIAFLKEQGIDEKDVKTEYYNVQPRYQYYDCRTTGICPPADIVGYEVSQGVLVRVRDFAKIGDLLSGVIERGANSVSQLSFTIDDPTTVRNEARAEAIDKAKEKAKAIAEASDLRLGRLLGVEEGVVPGPFYASSAKFAYGMGGGESVVPDIQPGSQDVTVNVTLRYEIK